MKAIIVILLLAVSGISNLTAQIKPPDAGKTRVEVYYFHPTERCPIDQSIEDNARKVVQTSFPDEMKTGILKFQVLNIDDKANEKIVAKFDVNTQALFIVKTEHGKEIKNNMTDFAFSYSKSNPTKFKSELIQEIKKALE
jgi:hypothetical protein